jgi:hypothetical protein
MRKSLERIQSFDVSSLPRKKELGAALSFHDAVEPASRIVNLFRQFPVQFLEELPPSQQATLQSQADSFFNVLDQILKFDPSTTPDSYGNRNALIQSLKTQYQGCFDALFGLISFLRIVPFARLRCA